MNDVEIVNQDEGDFFVKVQSVCCEGGPVTAGCYHDHCTGPERSKKETK